MRRLAVAVRSLLLSFLRALDVEGFLILGGLAGIAWIGSTFEWWIGALVVFVGMLVAGIALARPPRSA